MEVTVEKLLELYGASQTEVALLKEEVARLVQALTDELSDDDGSDEE